MFYLSIINVIVNFRKYFDFIYDFFNDFLVELKRADWLEMCLILMIRNSCLGYLTTSNNTTHVHHVHVSVRHLNCNTSNVGYYYYCYCYVIDYANHDQNHHGYSKKNRLFMMEDQYCRIVSLYLCLFYSSLYM